jgi:hypothetical protein
MSFTISKKYINHRCGLHLDEYQSERDNKKGIVYISRSGTDKFTNCSKHEHITKEKYDEIIPLIINEFLEAGFVKTQEFFKGEINLKKEYAYLMKDTIDISNITAQKTTKSNKIIREYMSHINEVEDHKGMSIKNQWTEDNLIKAFKSLDKPNATVNSSFNELKKKLKFNPVTIYSPIMSKTLIQLLDCKTIFDPCIGWGGRMIGTTCLGQDFHYTGCEPFTKTFLGLENMANDLEINHQVKLYHSPVEDILPELEDQRFDMCLTSPPYYDLEVYSHEDSQSIKQYPSYDEWLDKFIKPIIEFVCKNVDKYSCWSVKNIITDQKYNLLDDVIKIHEMNGWSLDRQFSIKKNTKKDNAADGDVTYVFVKG